jgi:hypothetical protein
MDGKIILLLHLTCSWNAKPSIGNIIYCSPMRALKQNFPSFPVFQLKKIITLYPIISLFNDTLSSMPIM